MDSERSAAVEAARKKVREAMIARTAYWYNAITCADDDLRTQIKSELAEADDEYDSALDAYAAACRAEGAHETLLDLPCLNPAETCYCKCAGNYVDKPCYGARLCETCASRAEKASAG